MFDLRDYPDEVALPSPVLDDASALPSAVVDGSGSSVRALDFERELADLINRHSIENGSNTPDFLLSAHLADCLEVYNRAIRHREKWCGRGPVASGGDGPDPRVPSQPSDPTRPGTNALIMEIVQTRMALAECRVSLQYVLNRIDAILGTGGHVADRAETPVRHETEDR